MMRSFENNGRYLKKTELEERKTFMRRNGEIYSMEESKTNEQYSHGEQKDFKNVLQMEARRLIPER